METVKNKTETNNSRNWRKIVARTEAFLIILGILVLVLSVSLTGARKPAIYLYPETDQEINVQLDVKGWLTSSTPSYNKGWEVFVTKEGIIEGKYDYLAYEAALRGLELPATGWVVETDRLENWLDSTLPELGFNKKEKSQFKDYWLQELPEANYYEIRLLENDYLEKNLKLKITPKPDTVIRRIFYFKPLHGEKDLEAPFAPAVKRKGFTVVEWGGVLED